jgi:adenylate cyclase
VRRTPFDAGRGMAGPEVQANALETMLRGAPLRDGPAVVDILAIVLLACVPAVAALRRSWRVTAAAVAAAAAAFLVAAQLAFNAGWIIAVVMPLVALALSAAGVSALAAGRAARGRMARSRNEPAGRQAPLEPMLRRNESGD